MSIVTDCHLLEDYLNEQLANNTYDLIANLALLKLYQFNPSLLSPSAALSSLLLALAHAPFAPDFSLCWSLLSDSFAVGAALPPPLPTSDSDSQASEPDVPAPEGEQETAAHFLALSTLLRARKFAAFWAALRSPKVDGPFAKQVGETVARLVASAAGFEATIRSEIANEVDASFVGIKRATLESFLGLEGKSSHHGHCCPIPLPPTETDPTVYLVSFRRSQPTRPSSRRWCRPSQAGRSRARRSRSPRTTPTRPRPRFSARRSRSTSSQSSSAAPWHKPDSLPCHTRLDHPPYQNGRTGLLPPPSPCLRHLFPTE